MSTELGKAACPVLTVTVGSLWRRKPPGREVLRIERVWDYTGGDPEDRGPTVRGHPLHGGRPLVASVDYLLDHYEPEQDNTDSPVSP